MKLYVNYDDSRWKKYKIDFEKIARITIDAGRGNPKISVTLTNDKKIRLLNLKYRFVDKPTNVLSFESGDKELLGDIFISFDTVKKEAKSLGISIEEHTAHLVVHGILHLLGYDHLLEKQAQIMENRETKILKKLGIKNPYTDEKSEKYSEKIKGNKKFLSYFCGLRIRENGFWQYIILFLLGAFAALGFAPWHLWWATLIAMGIVYWFIVIRSQQHSNIWKIFLHTLPFSAAYSIVMFSWVLNSIYVVPELANKFAIWTLPALLGIALIGGIIFSVPFISTARIKTFPCCRPFVFATVWALILWLREWLFTGFPWNPIANITMPFPVVANSMSLFGALGLSFVVMGFVASVVEILRDRKCKLCWADLSIFIILLVAGLAVGQRNITLAKSDKNKSPVVRIVQPAKTQSQKMAVSEGDAILQEKENLVHLLELANAPGDFDLIVFPETTYPFVVEKRDVLLSAPLNNNVILGAPFYEDGKLYNSMILTNTDGSIKEVYSKFHLVPFGEYSPFGIMPSPAHLSAGKGSRIVKTNIKNQNFSFAPAICYEIIFSDSLLPKSAETPDAIVNITNDTWFGKTFGPYQHLDMVRRYAIESGVPVIRANYSGISAFISSDGLIISALPVGKRGYLDGRVWGAHNTIYRKIGRDNTMFLILLFSLISIFILYSLKEKNKW